jgi:teichuronic acid biosynthesis glycosyltransferase TuaG
MPEPKLTNATSPRVSVIVPVFNAEKYISETLCSISAQDYQNFEVHVVDDASNDGTAGLIKEHCLIDSRFTYHTTPKNFGGPAGPRNIGISASIADYIAFCDADDIWMPHKLSTQIKIADCTNADVIATMMHNFSDSNELNNLKINLDRKIELREISHTHLLIKNWIPLSTTLVRRNTLKSIGLFNEAKSHIAVEDFDMWLRITQSGGRILKIHSPLVCYRKLPTSISANKAMMIRKALNIIGEDYARRDLDKVFQILRPLHWIAYVASSAWMHALQLRP